MNETFAAALRLLRRWLTTSPGPEPREVCGGGADIVTDCICPEPNEHEGRPPMSRKKNVNSGLRAVIADHLHDGWPNLMADGYEHQVANAVMEIVAPYVDSLRARAVRAEDQVRAAQQDAAPNSVGGGGR